MQELSRYLGALGIPGLFILALLDSAAVPIPGGAEALAMVLAWRQPAHLPWIILAGTLGATIGSLIFYRVGRAGGELALSRLEARKQEWMRRQVTRHAFWTLLISVALPPPFPPKPIVLLAGVLRTPLAVFLPAVLAGRLLRYSVVSYLGFRFGGQAAQAVSTYYPQVLGAAAALAVLILVGRRFLSRPAAH